MNMKLINTHKQKTRPIGWIANTKSNLALSVRKGVVNEARPSFYVTIVKHGNGNYFERAQPDFFSEMPEARTRRKGGGPGENRTPISAVQMRCAATIPRAHQDTNTIKWGKGEKWDKEDKINEISTLWINGGLLFWR